MPTDAKPTGSNALFGAAVRRSMMARQPKAASVFAQACALARDLSHTMGNPLAGLSLTLELLSSEPLDANQQRLVQRCLRAAERLVTVKENMGALGAAADAPLSQVDCHACCQAAVAKLPEGYAVRIDVQPGAQTAIAHPGLLTAALGHLVRNSVDAQPDGGCIGLRVSPLDDRGTARRPGLVGVRFTVWDSGPGVPQPLVRRLFTEPVSSKSHGGGSGLILASMIVQGVHRGRLTYEPPTAPPEKQACGAAQHTQSQPEHVCCFHVDLPGRSA
jgi:two-component system nitrogen regulation sensor histidine kinase GlnL